MRPVETPNAPCRIAVCTSLCILASCFSSGCTSLNPRKIADGGDAVAADPDVRPEPGRPGPVDDAPAGEDQIEDRRAEQRDHACGATATTPSSPSAPSTTARTGSAWRTVVASCSSEPVTSLVVY